MNKELYVSSTPHETKVALVEDDSLSEVYFERENEYTLAGSIYKGRVTRVLPGMQSAFVDIGLERDAFLYVSDFLDLQDDEDEEFTDVKVTGQTLAQANGFVASAAEATETADEDSEATEEEGSAEAVAGSGEADESTSRRWKGRRRRRGRRGGRERIPSERATEVSGVSEADAVSESEVEQEIEAEEQEEPVVEAESDDIAEGASLEAAAEPYVPMILPGESIARYQGGGQPSNEASTEAPRESRREERGRGRDRFGRGRDRDRGRGRREREPREPREPETPLPANYTPIVLPGESISKYRDVEPTVVSETVPEPAVIRQEDIQAEALAETAAAVPTVILPEETVSEPAVAAEPETVPAVEPVEPIDEEPENAEASVEAPRLAHYIHRDEVVEPEEEEAQEQQAEPDPVEPVPETPVQPAPEPEAVEVEKPEPDVQVEAVETEEVVEEQLPLEEEQEEETHVAGAYSPEGGEVEHEELDEEESDMPSFSEHYEHYHHHELEEETLEAGQFGETLRDADEERALDRTEYDFNGADEFEESEMLPDEEVSAESDEEGEEEEEVAEEAAQPGTPSGGYRKQRFERGRRGDRDRRPGRRGMRMRREPRVIPQISDVLKEGQEVLIQIAKEPINKKGARITSHIALPGRFLVYMPTVNHIGVSRKINSEEERQRLKRIVASERENGHGGFIVRTAASGIKEDELRADIRFLKHLWHEIRTRAENSKSPALIYHDLNLVERVLRDQVTADFSQIWVDSQEEYERVVRFASRFQPALTRRVKLYTKDAPLFEQFGIQEEINKSLKSKVWLKSGGYIVINQTEALVAIDINTGKYVGKTARLEDTIVKTNCDAIKEIVRQIRLRDLGGIIVIDFIDMDERKNRQKVMATLEEALKADRAPSKVLQFNDFGLVAITRKRVKQSLERTLGSACPYCQATGFVKSVGTVCNEIYSEMKKVRKHVESQDVTLRVNPEVAKELKSQNGKWLTELEELIGASILVKSDATLHQEQFDLHY